MYGPITNNFDNHGDLHTCDDNYDIDDDNLAPRYFSFRITQSRLLHLSKQFFGGQVIFGRLGTN